MSIFASETKAQVAFSQAIVTKGELIISVGIIQNEIYARFL